MEKAQPQPPTASSNTTSSHGHLSTTHLTSQLSRPDTQSGSTRVASETSMNITVTKSDDASPSPRPADFDDLKNLLPRLQVLDESSPSKPDNYRISPITPQSGKASAMSLDAHLINAKSTDIQNILDDWSGRGPHVDFLHNESVPLKEERFLGHGSMGGVYETTIRGHAFAWKRRFCRRRIGDAERKEIEILKKVSHQHIIQLAGSYTHRQFLGLLLYPVAVCDLATLLEDAEAYISQTLDEARGERLAALGLLRMDASVQNNEVVYGGSPFLLSKMGCIVRAVDYLHSQKIRHKDLKPSNILLSPDGLWLTDFGTATDFSLQTMSTTENCERGTPKYFAPEVAAFMPSGRAADIFSLGCVLLEMHVLYQTQNLDVLRQLRYAQDKSFQANLEHIQDWLGFPMTWASVCDQQIRIEIRDMLRKEPGERPSINEVCSNLALIDTCQKRIGKDALFDHCCRRVFISLEEYEKEMAQVRTRMEQNAADLMNGKNDSSHEAYLLRGELENANLAIAKLQYTVVAFLDIREHDTPGRYPYTSCPICGSIGSSRNELSRHLSINHPGIQRAVRKTPGPVSRQRFF